jgi:hypothetical protein
VAGPRKQGENARFLRGKAKFGCPRAGNSISQPWYEVRVARRSSRGSGRGVTIHGSVVAAGCDAIGESNRKTVTLGPLARLCLYLCVCVCVCLCLCMGVCATRGGDGGTYATCGGGGGRYATCSGGGGEYATCVGGCGGYARCGGSGKGHATYAGGGGGNATCALVVDAMQNVL